MGDGDFDDFDRLWEARGRAEWGAGIEEVSDIRMAEEVLEVALCATFDAEVVDVNIAASAVAAESNGSDDNVAAGHACAEDDIDETDSVKDDAEEGREGYNEGNDGSAPASAAADNVEDTNDEVGRDAVDDDGRASSRISLESRTLKSLKLVQV